MAIVNSDIYISLPESIRVLISGLQPGEAIVGRRTNIHSFEEGNASVYRLGFDLFIFHSSDIDKLLSHGNHLYFGEPWWDYDLFANLIAAGIHIRPLNPIHLLHLWHHHSFSKNRWAEIGFNSIQDLRNLARQLDPNHTSEEIRILLKLVEQAHGQICNFFVTQDACNIDRAFELTSDEHNVKPLRGFAHGLVQLGENVLGLQKEPPDSSVIKEACNLLLGKLIDADSSL